jgi:release factor glutamine methyltransferase
MSGDVYPPSEDTDLLLRALASGEPDVRGRLCADVGTGSGVVARDLARRGARVVAVDVNPHAAQAARPLAIRGDLMSALRGPFDVVAFNAPYLPSAPEERVAGWLDHAFHGGEGGVEVSERFVRDLPRVLAPDGRAYLVVSSRAELDRLERAIEATGLRYQKTAASKFFFEEIAVWRIARVTSSPR